MTDASNIFHAPDPFRDAKMARHSARMGYRTVADNGANGMAIPGVLTATEGDPLEDIRRAHRRPTTITVEIDVDTSKFVAAMLKAREAAADYRASLDKMNAILSPSIRVSLVLDIIDEVERDHDVDLHDIAARIRERIEEATR